MKALKKKKGKTGALKAQKTDLVKLAAAVAVCLLAGTIGSIATSPAIPTWYASLQKPFFSPPNWVFAPVWTLLYILMGVSAYLVWSRGFGDKRVKPALAVFGVQLFLNVLWSILFFGMRSPFYAFAEIIFLWLAIALAIARFYGISKNAAYLLVPYLLWVSFASLLNFAVWQLNP